MKFPLGLSSLLRASIVGAGLFAAGIAASAQSFSATTQTVAVKPQKSATSRALKMQVAVRKASAPIRSSNAATSHPSLTGIHPHSLPLPAGATVNAADFGSAEVHGTPVTMTLNYATPSTTLTAATTANTDFSVSASSCTTAGCSVTVVFTPVFPGLRYDAVKLTDGSGNLVYETYVHGIGNAPQIRFDLGGYTGYYGFTDTPPQTIAVGPDGTVYVSEMGGSSILKLETNGATTSFPVTGLSSPSGIAIDGSNTLYIADQANNVILSYDLGSGTQATVMTSPLSGPSQIAVDGTGALYIADTGHGRIIKLDNHGTETTLATGLNQPTAVAVDIAGDVYFADAANNGEIFEIAAGSSQTTTFQTNIGQTPRSLIVGTDGVVYLTTVNGTQRYYQNSSVPDFGADQGGPVGLSIKPNGGIVYTTPGANSFTVVDPQNGANFILSTPPGAQAQGTFTVSNTGNEPLTLSNLTVDLPQFTIDPSSICHSGTVLAPQATCDVTVDFTPPDAKDYTGHVSVTSDSLHVAGTTYQFIVYGQGRGDASHTDLTAAPTAAMVGSPVQLLATVVDETGNNTPSGTVTFYDGDVAIGSATLAPPNEHVAITVSNLSVGTHTITAQYSGDTLVRPNTSNAVTLVISSGPPNPNNGVSVTSHDFGTAAVGSNGNTFNVSYPQNSDSIAVTGDFTLGQSSCDVTCTVTITFQPQYPGLRQGVISRVSSGQLTSEIFAYGIGTAPQLGFNSGTDNVFNSIAAPTAIAVSPSNVTIFGSAFDIIIDANSNQVYEVTSDATTALPIRNLGTPAGIAIGPDGTVYVTDSTNNLIFYYNVLTDAQGVLATSQLSQPTGIVVDRMGNLFVLDTGNNRIIELTPQGAETTVASGVQNLASIATDSAGNVFFGTVTGNQQQGIYKIPVDGSPVVQVVNGEGPIHALAIDASGAFYFQNDNFTDIFPPPPQDQLLLGYQFPGNSGNRQTGLALAANGDVYATDSDTGEYFHSDRNTGNAYAFATIGSTANATTKVFNDGNAPLTLNAVTVSGTTFTILSSTTCVAGTMLPPGGNCDINVTFTPTQVGEDHEYLTITSNSLNSPVAMNQFDLYGEGSNPPQPTTTALTFSPSSPTLGQTVTLTATVSGPATSNIPPSGQVTFQEGSTVLGTTYLGYQTSGNTATANFPISTLSQGSHSVTAVYAGDPNYLTSTSPAVTIVVGAAAPAVVSSQNFGSVAVGQSVTRTITFNLSGITDIRLVSGMEYKFTQYTCTTSSCSVPVTFTPQVPGLRPDALIVRDTNGVLLAKAFLYGTGTGPQFGFLPGSSSIDTTYRNPTSITFDVAGVGYLTDAATDKVYPLYSGALPLPITGLGRPGGIAIDGAKTLYIADKDNNVIVTYNLQTGLQGFLPTTGLSSPSGVAVDGLGNVYIADTLGNRIVKVDNQGVQSTLVGFANTPQGVAVDSANNIYYTSIDNNGQIIEIPAAGGSPITIASFTNGLPLSIAVDPSGSVYYVGNFLGIRDVVPGVGTIAFSGQNIGGHNFIALNFNGDIWTTQDSNGMLESLHRATAAFTSSTQVGTSKQHTVQVVNTGNAPLTLSNVAFSDTTAFSLGTGSPCATGTVLQPGSECDTYVVFNPPAAQSYTSFLNYTSNTLNVSGSVTTDGEVGNGTAPSTAPSTTTLSAAPTSTTVGGNITFTATVSDAAGVVPTGTVNFLDGATVIGSAALSGVSAQSATASFSSTMLSTGAHSITAMYVGDTHVATSASTAQSVTITQASTTTSLAVSSSSIASGQPETLTATIAGLASPAMTGTVTFFEGTTQIGQGNVTATSTGGTAIYTTTSLAVGTHTITATYNGDANYTTSTSTAQTVNVTAPAVVVNSQNFGGVAVGRSASMTLTYAQGSTVSATYNLDFVVSTSTCGSTCTATVSFTPQYPGLREDAIVVKDANGYPVAKTFVYGTGTAPQFAFDIGLQTTPITFGSNGAPGPVAVGPDGTYYVADTINNQVRAYTTSGAAILNFGNIGTPAGLAVDGSNTVYVSDPAHNRVVYEANGVLGVVPGTFSQPSFLATDGTGALYVLDNGYDHIVKIDNQGNQTIIATTPQASAAGGIAVDPAGNVFFVKANGNNSTVTEVGGPTTPALNVPVYAIAIDAADRLYLSALDPGTNHAAVALLSPGATSTVNYPISTATVIPPAIAVDPAARILISEPAIGQVDIYDRSSGSANGITGSLYSTTQILITVSNTGNTTLTLSGIAGATANFHPDSTSGCLSGATLAPGATCVAIIDFYPTAAQQYTASLMFLSNSLNGPNPSNTFTLTGTGQTPSQVSSTTTLSASPLSAPLGAPVTLTATIADTSGVTPTGTVTFVDGTNPIGTANLGSATGTGMATAALTLSNLSLGAHNIRALYGGDPNVASSTSNAQTVSITQATTTTSLSVSSPNITTAQTETLTATIAGGSSPALTGTVRFYDGSNQIGTSTVTSTSTGGTATFTVSSLGVGAHQFTALYSGDSNYAQSTSTAATVTVTQAPATINSQNFGSAAVSGSPVVMTLTYPTVSGGITLSLVNKLDFTMSPQTCTQTACSTNITFSPKYPGLRSDALTVKDLNGNLVDKTFIYGTGTAPQFGFQPGLASQAFVGLVTKPTGVAVGPDGSIYVADAATNHVLVQFPSGSKGTIAFPTLGTPGGLAVDGSNTVYVADQTHNVILASTAAGVVSTVSTSALSNPNFLAVDGTGALYIADTGNNRIIKIDNQGTETTVRALTTAPLGLFVDAAINVYYADASRNGEITMLNAGGFGSTTVSGLGATINALGVDAAGRLYYTLLNNGVSSLGTLKLGVGISAKYAISTAAQAGAGLALDGSGSIIITEPSIGQVDVYARAASNASLTSQVGVQMQTTFTIANTGNAPMTVQNFAVSGSSTFTIDSATTCTAGGTVPVGQTCDFTIDFTPALAQPYQANIVINTDSLNTGSTTTAFTVFGNGTAAPTSATTLQTSATSIAVGQPLTLTATVTFATAQPTGTVNFFDGSTMIGSATLSGINTTTAVAQFTTSSLGLGAHNLTAMYAGNGTVPASTSPAQGVSVTQASTTTTIGLSAATLAVGQPETLTATIAGGASPAVSGMVTFFDGTISLGSNLVTATGTGGTASITVTNLGVGPHSITARYAGDTDYTGSLSAAQTVTVTQVTTTTTLAASPANLTVGQSEMLTATVTGGSGSPAASGAITFFDGTTQLGMAPVTATSTGATASLSLSTLAVGTHSITARYSGDTNYTLSASAAQIVTVAQATTTTTLGISAANITATQPETLTATVTGLTSPALTGTVTFFDGTTSLGNGTLTVTGNTGTASLTVPSLSVGAHSITARYNADTNYTTSASTAQTVTVGQAATTTTLAVSAAGITAGQSETLTATIAGAASPALTGVVTFFDGATSIGTGNVTSTPTGGTATLTLTTLAVGSRSLTARYGGDTNYSASVSGAQTVTVSGNSQTITFPTIPNHVLGDAPFALNATASSGLPVSYTVVSGPATISGSTVTLTGTGTVVVQATQAGNATYTAATPVSQSFTVTTPAPTLTSLTPAGAVAGASATTITLTGTNFTASDIVQINGFGVATTFANATTLTAIIPASSLSTAATLQVTVFDPTSKQTSASQTFTVTATPSVTFTGPTTTQPAAQPTLNVTLTNPYPVALTTTLTLTFAPASSTLPDDPNIQFATGGRTETFVIPANSTITPAILLQAGTVAGRITVTLTLTNPTGINVTPANVTPLVITIPSVTPAIADAAVARSGNTLTVTVHGFSNTREVSQAIFHFTAAPGSTVDTPDITADVSAAFATWFSSPASQQFGSSFTYTQNFNLTNDASTIGSVTVTLVNSIGMSSVGTAQ